MTASYTLDPGDIVGMDNLPAHKGAAVRTAIEAAATAYCCRAARTVETLEATIADAYRAFTPNECAN